MQRQQALFKMNDTDELRTFCAKVEKLKGEGLPMTTIAKRLGIPKATVYMRLARLRQILGV